MPLLDAVVLHLVLPRAAAHTAIWCCIPEDQELARSAVLMYCYHLVLCVRFWSLSLPASRRWLLGVRQRIFDAKYLVSTELQNYLLVLLVLLLLLLLLYSYIYFHYGDYY